MKKGFSLFFLIVPTAIILFILSSGDEVFSNESSSDLKNTNLIASSGLSAQNFWYPSFFEPMMNLIEEETNGRVTVDTFTSGEVVSSGQEYDALRNGSIDIALTLMGPYDPQRFPYTEVVMLPTLESDAYVAAEAMLKMMESEEVIADGKTYYELEFEDKGLVAFSVPPTEPYVFSTVNQQFNSVSDFNKNLQIRSAARIHDLLFENLGVSSISMPITDSYDALSRNALDGVVYNMPDWGSVGLDALFEYTIEGVGLGHFTAYLAMREDTWNNFTEREQEAIENAAENLIFEGAELALEETHTNKSNNIDHGGDFVDFQDLPTEVQEHIEEAVIQTWYDWIEKLEDQGLEGKKIAILWRDMLVDSGAKLPLEIMEIE